MELTCTEVFEKNIEALQCKTRYIINEGGSRSSKTFSICQMLFVYALQNKNKQINIFRKALATVKKTVWKDLLEVKTQFDKVANIDIKVSEFALYFENGTVIRCFGADDEQKLRGLKSDIAWLNEANELHYDDFSQIKMRTTETIILDYNPSSNTSWIYDIPEDKSIKIHSTYKNNPFLTQFQIEEIESFKETDIDYYTIYALGKRAFSKENVYKEFEVLTKKPDNFKDYIYAIDYGFTHPTAMLKIWYDITKLVKEVYIEELIYEKELSVSDLVTRINELNVNKSVYIISETARPEIIKDLRDSGYRVLEANKAVANGISIVKQFKVFLDSFATNTIKENQMYKYKKVNGKVTEEPLKLNDDSMDALRYGLVYIKNYLVQSTNNIKTYNFDFEN